MSKLPEYARGAAPGRLVRLLCENEENRSRYGEASIADWKAAYRAHRRDLTATCLYCGAVSRLPGLWVAVR